MSSSNELSTQTMEDEDGDEVESSTSPPNSEFQNADNLTTISRSRPTRGSLMRGALLNQGPTRIPPSLQLKMAAMVSSRNAQASQANPSMASVNQAAAAFGRVNLSERNPSLRSNRSAPSGIAAGQRRRGPGLKLSDIISGDTPLGGVSEARLGPGIPARRSPPIRRVPPGSNGTPFANFHKIVDPSGALNFGGKAVLHASGVDFSNGSSFSINMSQLQLDEELGRGNYGTVKKVLHKPTNVAMAMKEIRLELDNAKLNAILMELDVLHRAVSPEIVEFYGAFFIESCVYYCMEYMDAGSLDKLQGAGIPENVLARIAGSMTRGLKFLKDELQIIHRDVKPTNVLVNKRGDIKLCDFGVSGQLEKSLAKTNIGCQSYMAPERIKGESQNNLGTYTVSSDVWSLGLSIIEMAFGKYPYPPETYENVFAQLTAIVHGPPPELPDFYSEVASDFVRRCLIKEPAGRATYAELLEHSFLIRDRESEVDMPGWVNQALEHKNAVQQATRSPTTADEPASVSHDPKSLTLEALSLKVARHSVCSICGCAGLHPSDFLSIILDAEEISAPPVDDKVFLSECACGHGIEAHGNADNISSSERARRAKVAIRLDEQLDEIDKLLDFRYVDDDIMSLRKQMQVIQDEFTVSESLSWRSPSSPSSVPVGENSAFLSSPHRNMSPQASTSSLSDEDEDQPLASRVPTSVAGLRPGKSHSNRKLLPGSESTDGSAPDAQVTPLLSLKGEKPSPLQLERLVTGVTVDSATPLSTRPEKPCVKELQRGIIMVVPVVPDGSSKSLVILTGLKTLFQKQLPKMPREYISRLVYDHNSRALAIVKAGWKVVGGILFRPFAHRGFAEIVFFATASIDQIKGYGGMLMNHFKMHIKATYPNMTHFLTYADNYAVGYFKKQGFTKEITLDRSQWAGYIKDYEGATILQCSLLPRVDYIRVRETLSAQRETILDKIRHKSKSHIVHSARSLFADTATCEPVELDPNNVPGLSGTGWNFSLVQMSPPRTINPDQVIMSQLLQNLQNHPQSWAFLQPVNGEEVVDYYDVIKKPMDFHTMEHKLTHNLYDSIGSFIEDARLVFHNCLLYNPEDSVYAKNANKMQKYLEEQLALLAPQFVELVDGARG